MAPPAENAPLADRVRDLGFTPKFRDLAALFPIIGDDDEDLARSAERAVLRIDPQHRVRVIHAVIQRADVATRPERGRLTKLVGELVVALDRETKGSREPNEGEDASRGALRWLSERLSDADIKTRRTAARALGKLNFRARPDAIDERSHVEEALLNAWESNESDDDRRAFAEALGKLGSKRARERIAALEENPKSLGKSARRASIMIDREASREDLGAIDRSRAPARPLRIRFHARRGLEPVVSEELGSAWKEQVLSAGVVDTWLDRSLAEAVNVRTATHVGFPVAEAKITTDLAATIAEALLSSEAEAIFRTFTKTTGAIRFRLAFLDGKRRTNVAWRCAEIVREKTSFLVNDPTESTWEVVIEESRDRVAIELVPRGFDDVRFAYRTGLVPASSHPTLAAAIARFVPWSANDVVWDPFVGAGAELVERARLGPYAGLHGTDIDDRALEASRTNLHHAHIRDTVLVHADALTYAPPKVSVILSNPPMGRRVQRGTHTDLLAHFAVHAAKVLEPGGALVWALPEPHKVHDLAVRAGLTLERSLVVDMGGFPAHLCAYRKRRARVVRLA